MFITYDKGIPAKIGLTKISKRTKVLVYGESTVQIYAEFSVVGWSLCRCAFELINYLLNGSNLVGSLRKPVPGFWFNVVRGERVLHRRNIWKSWVNCNLCSLQDLFPDLRDWILIRRMMDTSQSLETISRRDHPTLQLHQTERGDTRTTTTKNIIIIMSSPKFLNLSHGTLVR